MRRSQWRRWYVAGAAALVTTVASPVAPSHAESAAGANSTARSYAARIAAGNQHTCAILQDGGVRCFGNAGLGQLGYGNTTVIGDDEPLTNLAAVELGVGRSAVEVSSSYNFTCAVLDDANLRCWGENANGQLGLANTTTIGDTEVPASVAVVDLGVGRTAAAVTTGVAHACAILDDGSVRCWGLNTSGELGYANATQIGDNEAPGSVGPVDLGIGRTATAIAAGWYHTCAILDDATLRCWGLNGWGQLGSGSVATIGDNETPGSVAVVDLGVGRTAVAVAAGYRHTCVVLDDGNVRCFGNNFVGQLGYGNTLHIGDNESPATAGPVNLGAGRTAVAITAAYQSTCALLDDGTLRCWGQNDLGQLGYANTTQIGDTETPDTAGPADLGLGRSPVAVDAGASHLCASLDDGALRCWGTNASGQLGNGNTLQIGDDEAPAAAGPVDFGGKAVTPPASPAIADFSACDGDATGTDIDVVATLSAAMPSTYSLDWATSDGTATAGSDYDSESATLTVPATVTTSDADLLHVTGDDLVERDETVTITATRGGVPVDTATVTIRDDDGRACDGLLPETPSGGGTFDADDDGDGEVVFAAASEDLDGRRDAGVVQLALGVSGAPQALSPMVVGQDSPTVPDTAERGDGFGATWAGGDFDGDGYGDLAVAAPFEDLGAVVDAGAVHVFFGGVGGLQLAGSQMFTQDSSGVADAPEANDRFGGALAAGDFNGDHRDDLAVGATESVGAQAGAGSVTILYGTPAGLSGYGSRVLTQNTPTVTDVAESGDAFGSSLAAGDVNGDARDDLAVGAFREDVGAVTDAGSVHVFLSASSGVSVKGAKQFTQASPSVADNPEDADRFSESLAIGDLTKDGRAEVVIGAPGEKIGSADDAGAVHVLRGSAAGPSASGGAFVSQSLLVADTSESGDRFGADVSLGDIDRDGRDDLAIGAPGETLGGAVEAGVVHILSNHSTTGIWLLGNAWSQDSPGLGETSEAWEQFGSRVELVDVTGDLKADLVVAVPGEDLPGNVDAGCVHVLRGTSVGITGTGARLLDQWSAGSAEWPQPGDRAGSD